MGAWRWLAIVVAGLVTATPPEALAAPPEAPAAKPLLSNGGFERDGGNGWPADWPHAEGATWEVENGNHFLRLKLVKPGQNLMLYRVTALRPGDKAYCLSVRARYTDLQYGKEVWYDGRVILNFLDKDGKKVGPAPPPPHWNQGTKDWATYTCDFLVPDGAVKLELIPWLNQVKSGTLDLDDLKLEAIAPEPLIEKEKAAAVAREAAAAKQRAEVKPKVPVPPADKLPPMLRVVGNQLQTPDGKAVWLQGVAIPSLEWSESGERILEAVGVAIKGWHANCIRLPVSSKFWFGKGPYRHDDGLMYRQIVDDAVNVCGANGAYLVLDLHRFRAPTEEDVAFWKDAAAKYKNHPAVILELFNEPHSVSWEVWRNGGEMPPEKKTAGEPGAEQVTAKGTPTVGMQKLLEVVRETGAKNVVIAGGLEWGYDLSGVVNGFALEDRGGNGVMYSSHIYPWKKDWEKKVLAAAAEHPIFVGEVGTPPDYSSFGFIPAAERYPIEGWAQDVLGLIQQHQLNWTAWSFHSKAGPCVLQDSKYTPTPYWGVFVKEALGGKPFEMKKLR